MDATLLFPFPVSVNRLFAGKGRRFRSAAYKDWSEEAGLMLNRQRPLPYFPDRVNLIITLGRPDNRRRDCGNYEKCVSDKLVEMGILKDDSLIECLTIKWGDVVGAQVDIQECLG